LSLTSIHVKCNTRVNKGENARLVLLFNNTSKEPQIHTSTSTLSLLVRLGYD